MSVILRNPSVLALLLLTSCAWSQPDNRPVWNAFEDHLVPEQQGLFLAALPLTVPLGFGSILVDTLIAHPLQVVGDAAEDAADLWDASSFKFDSIYYTELAFLPIRAAGTPIVFAGSFLGRSIFDIRARQRPMSAAESEAQAETLRKKRGEATRSAFMAWLKAPSEGYYVEFVSPGREDVDRGIYWHESYAKPMQDALAADASLRAALHVGMLQGLERTGALRDLMGGEGGRRLQFGDYIAEIGLRDPDPVVRYMCVKHWPSSAPHPAQDVVDALCSDPVEAVRLLAKSRFDR